MNKKVCMICTSLIKKGEKSSAWFAVTQTKSGKYRKLFTKHAHDECNDRRVAGLLMGKTYDQVQFADNSDKANYYGIDYEQLSRHRCACGKSYKFERGLKKHEVYTHSYPRANVFEKLFNKFFKKYDR